MKRDVKIFFTDGSAVIETWDYAKQYSFNDFLACAACKHGKQFRYVDYYRLLPA